MIAKRLASTGLTFIGENHDRMVGGWIVQVSGTFSGALKFRKKLKGSVVADADAPLFGCEDMSDGSVVAANTGITAPGQYKVITDLSVLILDYTHSSGQCVVELESFLG